jgi:hypothetical protein
MRLPRGLAFDSRDRNVTFHLQVSMDRAPGPIK